MVFLILDKYVMCRLRGMHAPHLFLKEEESVDPEHLAYIAHVKKILKKLAYIAFLYYPSLTDYQCA